MNALFSPPRRRWLQQASLMALAALTRPLPAGAGEADPAFVDYPFKLGVASGDPLADGFVLWTRLAPNPLAPDGGMGGLGPVRVTWEVAADAEFASPVRRGAVLAHPGRGFAVHVDVTGLEPDRGYFYRFSAGEAVSPTGRVRTFPVVGAPSEKMRLAWASCAHYGQGYFGAYRHMVADDLDLVIHVGDYLYESTWGPRVRFHLPEPFTLEQYRSHHALYKTDPDLQAAHARYPWLVTWDDHEVDNDYAGFFDENNPEVREAFVRRRAAAYQAYYEHMPLRLSARPQGADMHLYSNLQFGDLAHLMVLDNRQYRDDQACPGPGFGGQIITDCDQRLDPARSMLGLEQEEWLQRQLNRPSRWRIIAQQTLMAALSQGGMEMVGDRRWSDGWDGYAATRARLLTGIAERNIDNVIVLGGDVHSFWVTDLKVNFDDPRAPAVATEFVTTSVTAASGSWGEALLPANPHVKFHAWRHRGYGLMELTPGGARVELRAVDNVNDPKSGVSTLKAFAVEAGKPGAVAI
ncbi:MAG: alkaline phosphatase D family protein [Candidatus Competibacterales bacterium]